MEISGPRIGLRAMQLETVLAHVSQQLITCGRVRKHLTVRPEVGAVCEKDACPDLCGGREVTCVPTATAWYNGRLCNRPSWRRAHATAANTHVGARGHHHEPGTRANHPRALPCNRDANGLRTIPAHCRASHAGLRHWPGTCRQPRCRPQSRAQNEPVAC